MIPIYQTKYGLGRGNCFAACVASLLNMLIEDVPNIETLYECSLDSEHEFWVGVMDKWLTNKGYTWRPCPEAVSFHKTSPMTKDAISMVNKPYIAIGYMTPNSTEVHACLYMNGSILHNPNNRSQNKPLHRITMLQVIEDTLVPYKDRVNKEAVCALCKECTLQPSLFTDTPPPLCESAIDTYLSTAVINE